jgi:hypothetical protein
LEVFGFHTSAPWRLAVIASVAAISVAMFILARARIGVPLAAMLAIWLLWAPGLELFPPTLNFYLALAATIVCAIELTNKGRPADVKLGIALTFALCCSGVGVAAAVGCDARDGQSFLSAAFRRDRHPERASLFGRGCLAGVVFPDAVDRDGRARLSRDPLSRPCAS